MADTAADRATTEEIESMAKSLKESNDDRKKDKLARKITRAHEWRVQVWAQMELKIRADIAAMEALNGEAPALFEPDFESQDMLQHYADMTLSK